MAASRSNVSGNDVERLQRKRLYEARCAIKQRDEQARAVREDEYLKTFISQYESLASIQGDMRRRMNDIFAQVAAESRKKKLCDAVHRIEAEKVRRVNTGLQEYECRIQHMRLDVQAKYLELCRRNEEGET